MVLLVSVKEELSRCDSRAILELLSQPEFVTLSHQLAINIVSLGYRYNHIATPPLVGKPTVSHIFMFVFAFLALMQRIYNLPHKVQSMITQCTAVVKPLIFTF